MLQVDGVTSVSTASRQSIDPASRPTSHVAVGETIHTGADGRMALSLVPGTLIQLEPNSTLTVERLKITKAGNAANRAMGRSLRLRLSKGVVVILLEFGPRPTDGSIETPNGALALGSRGLCRLEVKAEKARLTCLRGEFPFRMNEGDFVHPVPAGYVQEWPSPRNVSFPADSDASSQSDVEESLGVERILLELERHERFSPYPWRQP